MRWPKRCARAARKPGRLHGEPPRLYPQKYGSLHAGCLTRKHRGVERPHDSASLFRLRSFRKHALGGDSILSLTAHEQKHITCKSASCPPPVTLNKQRMKNRDATLRTPESAEIPESARTISASQLPEIGHERRKVSSKLCCFVVDDGCGEDAQPKKRRRIAGDPSHQIAELLHHHELPWAGSAATLCYLG